jgi:hypothetical protein
LGHDDGEQPTRVRPQRGVDASGMPLDRFANFFNGLSRGAGVSVAKGAPRDPERLGPRPSTPSWLLSTKGFGHVQSWLYERAGKDPAKYKGNTPARLRKKERELATPELDFEILFAYYRLRWEDQTIFRKFQLRFLKEHGSGRSIVRGRSKRKKKWTCSEDAVRKRRARLVAEGNAFFPTDFRGQKNISNDFMFIGASDLQTQRAAGR